MWRHITKTNIGLLAAIDSVFCRIQERKPWFFPNFGDDGALLVASDYSGQHESASYDAYSFVFTTPRRWAAWENHRVVVRTNFLLTRRFSFKTLGDKKRWKVLPHYLGATGSLEAVAITILVNKNTGSLFASSAVLDCEQPELVRISSWKAAAVEKLLRVLHLMALLAAGFSCERQDLYWISDEDDIVANEDRIRDVVKLFVGVSSNLLEHNLRHFRLLTTASDDGTMQLEDFVAIPDFCAGAVVEVMTKLNSTGKIISPYLIQPVGPDVSLKTRALVTWLAARDMPLRHIVIALDQAVLPGQINVRHLAFDAIVQPSFSP